MTKRFVQEDSDRFSALVLGTQGYLGENRMRQGPGLPGAEATFGFNPQGPLRPESDFTFPNAQRAAFAQGIVALSDHLSITPGLRVEGISTFAEGTYREVIYDGAGNVVEDSVFQSTNEKRRTVLRPGGWCVLETPRWRVVRQRGSQFPCGQFQRHPNQQPWGRRRP